MANESIQEKIKSKVGNLFAIMSFNIGFSFFEPTILIDVLSLAVLAFCLYKWYSRVSALLILVLGANAFYFQLEDIGDVGGWRMALIIWWIWSGVFALFYTFQLHAQRDFKQS